MALRVAANAPLRALYECLDAGTPLAVRLVDVEDAATEVMLPASSSGVPYRSMLALIRGGGQPLGWMVLPVDGAGTVSVAPVADAVKPPREPRASSPDAPHGGVLSVVVTTCADVEPVLHCVDGIRACEDENIEIVVVENRPVLSIVERALEERYAGDPRVRYVEEHARGLARARNAGLRAARGGLVAFTDDDIVVDPGWVRTLRAAFAAARAADCVTGLILPFELETATQVLVERFAGFGKGFVARTYSLEDPPVDQPLFPYTAGYFGSGANMAFRTGVLRELGGFDPALGAGTRTRGGEDLDICIRLLQAGGRLAYEPGAIVWHRHPDVAARLRQQVFGYGVGLGAMLGKHVLVGSDRWSILSQAPGGIRYLMHPRSRKNAARGPTFPRDLSALERLGMACGPLAYLASRLERRR